MRQIWPDLTPEQGVRLLDRYEVHLGCARDMTMGEWIHLSGDCDPLPYEIWDLAEGLLARRGVTPQTQDGVLAILLRLAEAMPWRRQQAVERLWAAGHFQALTHLPWRLEEDRFAAAWQETSRRPALVGLIPGLKRSAEVLARWIRKALAEPSTRRRMVSLLRSREDMDYPHEILAGLLDDADAGVRGDAILALMKRSAQQRQELLCRALDDTARDIGREAVQAFARQPIAIAPALIDRIWCSGADLRIALIRSLWPRHPDGVSLISKGLDDDQAQVRIAAMQQASHWRDPGLVERCGALVRDPDATVRRALIDAIRSRQIVLPVSVLAMLAVDPDAGISSSACQLAEGLPGAATVLVAAIAEGQDATAIMALRLMLRFPGPRDQVRQALRRRQQRDTKAYAVWAPTARAQMAQDDGLRQTMLELSENGVDPLMP